MTIAKAPAGAPPVLWIVMDKFGNVFRIEHRAEWARSECRAINRSRKEDYAAPFRVVAYVPRDTP